MYLIDTNHFSFIFIQQNETVLKRLSEIGQSNICINTIIYSELLLMVAKSGKKEENLKRLEEFIVDWKIIPIDKATTKIYGEITSKICSKYMPSNKKERRDFKVRDAGVRMNDLWIACTAIQQDLIIVSEDKDFEIINEFKNLKLECWKTRKIK